MIYLAYLTVAAGCVPMLTRRRYAHLHASHPTTHPRDVRHDLTRATVQGCGAALLWLPLGCVYAGHRAVVYLGVRCVGQRTVARHLRAARTEQWEAELAALPPVPDDDLDVLLKDATDLAETLREYEERHGPSEQVALARRHAEARAARLTRRVAS